MATSLTTSILSSRRGALGLLAILLCAVAIGAVNLSALQMVATRVGSYGPAALVVGSFSLGNALGLILQGRLIDRFSPTRVIIPAATLFAATLVTAVFWNSGGHLVYVALFLVAGLSLPAVIGVVRAAVPVLYPRHLRLRLYSAIAVTFQGGMACGPLVASAFHPLRESGYAFLAIAGFVVIATVFVVGLPRPGESAPRPVSTVPPATVSNVAPARLPLLSPGYVTILLATVGFGISTGVVTVGLPAVLDTVNPAFVGASFTALALGDLSAGVVYGSRRWPGTLPRHLRLSLFSAAVAAAMLAVSAGVPVLAVVLMFVLGAMGTPAGIVTSALLDTTVPASRLTVAYTTMIATNLVAVSIGSSAGGAIIGSAGAHACLVLSPLGLLCAGVVVALRRRSLQ